jgi:zinc protease
VCALLLGVETAAAEPRLPGIRAYAFPGGPTALLMPDSLAGAAHIGLWFPTGPEGDPAGRAGLASVMGRASFAPAAATRSKIEAAGGSFDFMVSSDLVAHLATLPAEQAGAGLEALTANLESHEPTAAVLHDAVESARSEREWWVSQSPLMPGIERVCASLYAGRPYAKPAAGLDAELSAITLEDARTELGGRFAPSRALVTVSGRFDADQVLASLSKKFGSPAEAKPVTASAAPSWTTVTSRTSAGKIQLPVPVMLMGWRLPPDRDADAVALEVLTRAIATGPGAPVARALVTERGSFLRVEGSFERRRESCLFAVAAALAPGFDSTSVETDLAREIERWGREPLAAADLEAAKHGVESELLQRAKSAAGRARSIATAQLLDGDWRAFDQRLARVRSLTAEDVRRAAGRALSPANRAIVWTAPAATGGRP